MPKKPPSNRSVDRKTGGKARKTEPTNEPQNNVMEQQTGRMRSSMPVHLGSSGGRRRTRGGQRPR